MPKYEHKLELSFVIEHGDPEPLDCPDYVIANSIYRLLLEMKEKGLKNTGIEIWHSDTREIDQFSKLNGEDVGWIITPEEGE